MIWLVGSGLMSIDYAKVLDAQGCDYQVIGRGSASAKSFTKKTGKAVVCGGLAHHIANTEVIAEAAIVSVGVAQLYETTKQLIEAGVKKILVEKPGAITLTEIEHLYILTIKYSAEVFIAYNRRFFSSVLEAQNLIELDGGVTSFNFEFTEWSHVIEKMDKSPSILERWFLGNSTHVADLAFYLGGKPREVSCFVDGSLSWHNAGAVFSGAGISETGALFNYSANWQSAGRWSVQIMTSKNRYYFCPLEQLQVQRKGSIVLDIVAVDDTLDREFKPGLYRQVKTFLSSDTSGLCSLMEQYRTFAIYEKIAGYNE